MLWFTPMRLFPIALGPFSQLRRHLLSAAALAATWCSNRWAWSSPMAAAPAVWPSVFELAPDRARIHLLARQPGRYQVRLDTQAPSAQSLATGQWGRALTPLVLDAGRSGVVEVDGLRRGQTLVYAVYGGERLASGPHRVRTLPEPGASFTLMFSGDLDERHRPFDRMFSVPAVSAADFGLLLGDTMYADIPKREFEPTAEHYRHKAIAVRSDPSLAAWLATHPTWAIWDDHEIENGANGAHPGLAAAATVFGELWAPRGALADAFHRVVRLHADVDLFILDTRRWRSPQSDPAGPGKTMLGPAQKGWFVDAFSRSQARFRLVATSVPFHGGSDDSWGNYADERDELLALFRRETRASDCAVVLLSADYHYAREWPRSVRHGIHELTVGPMAAFLPFERTPSLRERHTGRDYFVFGDRENVGLLDYDPTRAVLTLRVVDRDGIERYRRTIEAGRRRM